MNVEVNRSVNISFFGKIFTVTRKNGIPALVFFILYYITHIGLNFSAIVHAIVYATGMHILAAVILFIVCNIGMSKLSKNIPIAKKLNSAWWYFLGIAGIYWAIYHSQWSTVTIGLLIGTTIMNFGIKLESKGWAIEKTKEE